MKLQSGWATLCGLAGLAAGAWAAEVSRIPVEDFVRAPQFTGAALSPDGATIGYTVRLKGRTVLGFLDVATMKITAVEPGVTEFTARMGVGYFRWVSNDRVLLQTTAWDSFDAGLAAVNRDRTHWQDLTGFTRWESQHGGGNHQQLDSQEVIFSGRDAGAILVLNYSQISGEAAHYPEVVRLNTMTGDFSVVQPARDKISFWAADWDGVVRFGFMSDGVSTKFTHRDGAGAAWREPIDFGTDTKQFGFAGLDADGHTLYLFKPSPNGCKALYSYDLTTGQTSGPLFQHKKYDVAEAIFSPKFRRLLGVRYVTEGPRRYWFEPELLKLQKEIDATHPDLVNMIVSMDWEMQHMLVFSYSARESGYYTLLDLSTHKSRVIAMLRPWLKAEDMAEMHPITWPARDGLELNGYLTLPAGGGQKNLPTVVLVHGGPFGVRDAWGFDPLVQFLANRGYAVLQVNYRGSGGYGTEFYDKGRNEIGGKIQEDIEDATRWLVKQGVADSHRLAIMGASYGGYSTLYALAQTPDLFRCGVACMAVTDWNDFYKHRDDDEYRYAFNYWRNRVGDLNDAKVRRRLAEVSPVNLADRIKAPVFIMHGEEDRNVPPRQAKAMIAALKKAGQHPETYFAPDTGHAWPMEEKGVEFLTRLEAFLAANLGK